jgi:aryl-alcohol dehydrogenase-like predicted oxidoreductase
MHSLAFGTYRANGADTAFHTALAAGVRYIDTATSYGGGDVAKWLGKMIQQLHAQGQASIVSELKIVSKIGVVQGNIWSLIPETMQVPEIWPGTGYCLDPTVLARQFARHLEDLRVDAIDSLLIHNPEVLYRINLSKAEVMTHLHKAFVWLEAVAAIGKIKAYGVASNALAAGHLTIADILAIAHDVAGAQHHCRVIQVPLNLYEAEQVQPIDDAHAHSVHVMVHRPFNIVQNQRVWHLTLPRFVDPQVWCAPGNDQVWSAWCEYAARQNLTYAEWVSAYMYMVKNADASASASLPVQQQVQALGRSIYQQQENYCRKVQNRLKRVLPETLLDLPLSAQVMWPLWGIGKPLTVVTGMHQPTYVQQAVLAAQQPGLTAELFWAAHNMVKTLYP